MTTKNNPARKPAARKAAPVWETKPTDGRDEPHHYFASSVAEWRTATDLPELLRLMQRDRFPFNVYRVSLPETANYHISNYKPQVKAEQICWVGFWQIKE